MILVLAATGFGVWWASGDSGSDAARFLTAPVERRALAELVEATGRVGARGRFVVAPALEARILAIHAQEGDEVEAGALLAELEPVGARFDLSALGAARAAARARAAQAGVVLDEASRRLARVERLEARGQASTVELEAARTEVESARAGLRAARAEVEAAEARLQSAEAAIEGARVEAPRAGVVLRVGGQVGQMVGPGGAPLFELAPSLDPLKVRAEVGEADVGRLAPGQVGHFEVPAHPGVAFEGRVERIGVVPEARGGVSFYPVTLLAPNPEGRLRPGMTASVRFEVARVDDALVVREAALRFTVPGAPPAPPRSRVFVRRGEGDVVPVPVRRGLSDGAFTAVVPEPVDALRAGDQVVIGVGPASGPESPGITLGGEG